MGGDTNHRMAAATYPKMVEGPVGKQIHNLFVDRLRMFIDNGQYKSQSLLAKMFHARVSGEPSVKLSVYSPPDQTRPTFKEATSHKFKPTKVGELFGPSWSTHWIKAQLTVPKELKDEERLELHWDANNEGLIWSEGGEPLQGLTGGGERVEWILPDTFRDGKEHTIYIEMACNGMFGNAPGGDTIQPPIPDRYFQLTQAEIVSVNLDARGLFIDFWVVSDAAREFPQDSWQEHEALQVCLSIMDCFAAERGSDECIKKCRKIARKFLSDTVDSADVYKSDEDVLITGVGHCHIDTCWLWPWAETKRKVARSWANQIDLMERYPEHRFACSQAQQYKWLKQLYPSLFDRVKAKVKEGRFQPIGGSWVEHDTNLPSGESLVRQFLYGQRFFESNFGERCQTFWLPDTFGYSSQLPQLCRLSGMTRFFTQKLSWNNINNFPHTTFNWVSLDGSQVLCHMPPSETYTAEADFGLVTRSVTQHKSMDQDATSLLIFGKGDGGGGPTWSHIEKLRRCRAISDKVGRLPRVKVGDSVDDFFARLEKKGEDGTKFVTWYGELYFEFHRGTYTSQSNNKRNNRKTEILLRDVEYLATLASISKAASAKKYKYPKREIDEMWEGVLLCQFHDCLPGSSIEMCYRDSDELYAKIFKTGEKLLADAMSALGFDTARDTSLRTTQELFALNTTQWDRAEIIKMPSNDGAPKFAMAAGGPGMLHVHRLQPDWYEPASIKAVDDDIFLLANALYDLKIKEGVIVSLYDKQARREVIPAGQKANQLVLFDDKPLYWQAWDVEVYHLSTREELKPHKTAIYENSPERVSVLVETRISADSWVKTTVALNATPRDDAPGFPDTATSPSPNYVDIHSEVHWHESCKFLKVEFPVDVRNTEASYETQFGIVKRPTHYNTTWDMAKFEVCCHKFADLSDATYGASVLNDSKYGFATVGNVMRLSLLRAPKAPDAHADMGTHHIRYALFPHAGPLDDSTVRAAIAFNNPISTSPSTSGQSSLLLRRNSPVGNTSPSSSLRLLPTSDTAYARASMLGIVIDTVKRAEDDADVLEAAGPEAPRVHRTTRKGEEKSKSVIVRMYDALGGASEAFLAVGAMDVARAFVVNLLEDELRELDVVVRKEDGKEEQQGVVVRVGAFEVVTVKLVLK